MIELIINNTVRNLYSINHLLPQLNTSTFSRHLASSFWEFYSEYFLQPGAHAEIVVRPVYPQKVMTQFYATLCSIVHHNKVVSGDHGLQVALIIFPLFYSLRQETWTQIQNPKEHLRVFPDKVSKGYSCHCFYSWHYRFTILHSFSYIPVLAVKPASPSKFIYLIRHLLFFLLQGDDATEESQRD